MPFIILTDKTEQNKIPIWIGLFEASAIATELEKIQLSRPMTHDLIKGIFEGLGTQLKRIEITDLKENTFYASLILEKDGKEITIDSRPSDAIAIALRTNSPIFVHEDVIEKGRKIDLAKAGEEEKATKEKWTEILENLNPEDFGKYKM